MTVQPINPTTSLLYLTRAQLLERGLDPDTLTHRQTAQLARECLSALGQETDCVLELERYPDKSGLLLFIHTAPAVWRFFDGDALLDAAVSLSDLDAQPLYWWKGAFWAVGRGSASLSEFAEPVDDPLLDVRLAEYGQRLA